MPRFVARPVTVEAHQFTGSLHTWPDAFMRAVTTNMANGQVMVATAEGLKPCKSGDWIMRGPDGVFAVMRQATFEAMFAEQGTEPQEALISEPSVESELVEVGPEVRAKRPYTRRTQANAY